MVAAFPPVELPYAVLRPSATLPCLMTGQDVDILCIRPEWLVAWYQEQYHTARVATLSDGHTHIDVDDVRYDLICPLQYPTIAVSPWWTWDALHHRRISRAGMPVLADEYEAVGRLWEWVAYGQERPQAKYPHWLWARDHWADVCYGMLRDYCDLPMSEYPLWVKR